MFLVIFLYFAFGSDPQSDLLLLLRYSNEGFVKETLLSLAELLQVIFVHLFCSELLVMSIHICAVF